LNDDALRLVELVEVLELRDDGERRKEDFEGSLLI